MSKYFVKWDLIWISLILISIAGWVSDENWFAIYQYIIGVLTGFGWTYTVYRRKSKG